MFDPIATVKAFVADWGTTRQGIADAYRAWFLPDTLWDNVGLAKTTGPEEAIALLDGFVQQTGVVNFQVEWVHLAVDGDVVLTERIDQGILADGSLRQGPPMRVMGAFEIRDGKIAAWRDYFDTAGMIQS